MGDCWSGAGTTGRHLPAEGLDTRTADGSVVLAEGTSFAICEPTGDIGAHPLQGLFLSDVRVLSRFALRLNGAEAEALAVVPSGPFAARFVARAKSRADQPEPTLVVTRHRHVGIGMREDIEIANYGEEAAYCSVELWSDADFASASAVKEGAGPDADADVLVEVGDGELAYRYRRGAVRRTVRLVFSGSPRIAGRCAAFELVLPAGGTWTTNVEVAAARDGEPARHAPGRSGAGERLARWRRQVPEVHTAHAGLRATLARSADDLGALRLYDPEHPERVVVAAGVPWLMSVYGRDSLLTSWMALPLDPDLALGVLQTLARFQGSDIDPRTEEEPGRILHEMRFGETVTSGGGSVYYGAVDATPLFVMLLGELRRWGLAREAVDELLPHADRALEWILHHGDRDGDGYVEYQRATDRGLVHQGWKDSAHAVRFADGRIARPPIALCEVQGYTYAAYVARSHFAVEAGDDAGARRWRARADALKEAFNRDFWLDEHGWFAMGLDADNRPIDALASNIGHCLWTGIVDRERAPLVAARLLSAELFSGWGIRTLATSMRGYNPVSYHCGAVWPHDTAIAAAGLVRYGFVEEAQRLVMALLDAAVAGGGRLPELFSGLPRADMPAVVAYPGSCSPQAVASAAPLLLLRAMLRLEPRVPQGKVWLAPALPEELGDLVVDRVPLGGGRIRIEVTDGKLSVEGLPPDLRLVEEARSPTRS